MPRLKDLKDQQLYRIDRGSSHGAVDVLYRGTVDVALIRDQYDALVRIASSLRNRTAPAHVVLERLAASSDRPARALTMLGRIVKTIYILRYLQDAAIRDRVQLQLNRGESRHELARRLFFANQGAFRAGDYEEIAASSWRPQFVIDVGKKHQLTPLIRSSQQALRSMTHVRAAIPGKPALIRSPGVWLPQVGTVPRRSKHQG
jgi:TnpA family transposase